MQLVQKVRHFVSKTLRVETWLLSGLERHGGQKLTLAYSGPETQRQYFAGMAFQEGWSQRSLGRGWIWRASARVRRESPDCALLVYELDDPKEKIAGLSGLLRSPVWVRFDLPLDPSHFSTAVRERYKNIERKIRKHALTSSVSRSEADFDDFYHNMYVPFVRERHGASSLVHPYDDLKQLFFSHGELVLVHKDGKVIASSILDYSRPEAEVPYHGIRDGSEEYIKMGVSEALYLFEIIRIRERSKSKVMSLGHCRAFFNDSVFRYKLRLGACIAQGHYLASGCLRFQFLSGSEALRRFLCENPFVSLDKRGRYSAAFFSATDFSAGDVAKELDDRHCKGLKDVTVYVFGRPEAGLVHTPDGREVRFLPASRATGGIST